MTARERALKMAYSEKTKPTGPKQLVTVDYWRACELIGEAEASRVWGAADADQGEALKIEVLGE